MQVGFGEAWLVLDTGKGGFKEKRLGTTDLVYSENRNGHNTEP